MRPPGLMIGFGAMGQLALGQASNIDSTTVLAAAAGAFSYPGNAARVRVSLVAGTGTFSFAGQAAFKALLTGTPDAATLAGPVASFRFNSAAGAGAMR
jgi:hypothetical protein